jgi:hypothetical protein
LVTWEMPTCQSEGTNQGEKKMYRGGGARVSFKDFVI